MELSSLISALAQPRAWPVPVAPVEVRQTHISAVFLAGDLAYKVKKPVKLPFLDFSTLELRRQYCEAEVRLNRRLAPHVYLGVVPVTQDGPLVRFEGQGQPIDWAVKMQRLPEAATLEQRLLSGEIDAAQMRRLAERLAGFHASAESGPQIAEFGRFESVARNLRENFEVAAPTVGVTSSRAVRDRLMALTENALSAARPLIDARAARGVPRDTHGDLHLDHVYLFPGKPAPQDLVIVDCIEFNERFRYTDPVADMAFLAMDLKFHGRRDLAAAFSDAWFAAARDDEGRALYSLYVSYRAAVRAKVNGLLLAEPEVPGPAKAAAFARARGHWLLALAELEPPAKRPCLILTGGLPGSGKSTLARQLGERAGFFVVRSDVVRKELAGVSVEMSAPADINRGIYTSDWTERTYAECLKRAEQLLFDGQRVIVDATFVEEQRRHRFLETAVKWGVPGLLLVCELPPEAARTRLADRKGDASDANWEVYEHAAARWDMPGDTTQRLLRPIDTSGTVESAADQAVAALHEAGLAS